MLPPHGGDHDALVLVVDDAGVREACLLEDAAAGGPVERRVRDDSCAPMLLSMALGVGVIMLGDVVCLLALMFFGFHGYQEDAGTGRANTLWFAVPTLALALGLIGVGISVIRAARFPAEDQQGPIVTRV